MDLSIILKKKGVIRKKIEELENKNLNVNDYWVECDFNNPKDLFFGGGDGSFNNIDYISYSLYMIGSISYLHRVGEKIERAKSSYDIDIIQPYVSVRDRLRLYMLTMELKNALWTLENKGVDYYLIDGSLYSLLIQTHTYGSKYVDVEEIYNNYSKEIKNLIEEEIKSGDIRITSNNIEVEDKNEKIVLEQVEYIITFLELLKKYKDRLIGISKTSKINIYFKNALMPDIAVFSKNTKNSGYSIPISIENLKKEMEEIEEMEKNSNKLKRKHDYLKRIINNIEYINKFENVLDNLYLQFVRLENNKGILGISSLKPIDEHVLSSLREISVNGYPYILKKSHENVEITDDALEMCAKILKINETVDRYLLKKQRRMGL
ncbi:DNA double-strand break repair nuclease NurA [Methanotorris formicicus]|uniref:NurA domain protein n=1 Tax=Methanotorris formicicus Mc-S-70 TaxID=647171 RepID=H1KWN9_9EURY|nr:DNA double-strand break repair nuclease NurA [Methanotorris formicicus]EHP89154.1 NurA domain protein [Methanotorris formicicus Mc-S-70]